MSDLFLLLICLKCHEGVVKIPQVSLNVSMELTFMSSDKTFSFPLTHKKKATTEGKEYEAFFHSSSVERKPENIFH